MAIELKLNHNKMGTKPRGETWEWYTTEIPDVGFINVHNRNGDWTFEIRTGFVFNSRRTYDTKEAAFTAALKSLQTIAIAFSESVEETLGREL